MYIVKTILVVLLQWHVENVRMPEKGFYLMRDSYSN
jgi:hypothetical protein